MHEATHETTTTRQPPSSLVAFPKGGRRSVKVAPTPKQETILEILQDAGRIADEQRRRANAAPTIHGMILDCLSLADATRQYRQPVQPKPAQDKTHLNALLDQWADKMGVKTRFSKLQPVVEPVVKPVSAATEARRVFRTRVRNGLAIDAIAKAARDAAGPVRELTQQQVLNNLGASLGMPGYKPIEAGPCISRRTLRGNPIVVLSVWREARA